MKIIEIADAIPKSYQEQVESELGSSRMTWNFHEESARSASMFKHSYSGFGHTAYLLDDVEPIVSPLSSLLLPILFMFCEKAKLEYSALLRIRVGLFTKTALQTKHHNPHVDFGQPHQTAVYYVNDSDGDTFVFNETFDDVSVENSGAHANANKFTIAGHTSPKKGTMICFEGKHYHASMHPMKATKRIAITFNFL